MRRNILIVLFFTVCYPSKGQQIINHVYDPSAAAIRGVAIPGKVGAAVAFKNEEANEIIPAIIKEEKDRLGKWRKSIIGSVNSLNTLASASRMLIDRIDSKRGLILPAHYAPGFRHDLREFVAIKERTKRLEKRVLTLLGIGTFFIDGEGYYRVACQKLALEYLEVYADLSKIDFNITKLLAFIGLFFQIGKNTLKT
ncbi:hypothetical protein [Flavobacterium poyangense]|uniref:hypothetical protein n=1 Tax=Flavobacterium poyangense TaxID=2204302 RepID=UPI00141DA8DD|nr:hypothetical protein [Flavobacterium sp. JXAS1]